MPSKSRKFSQSEVECWSLEAVKEWLVSVKLESCIEEFLEQNVDGSALLELTYDDIKEMVQTDKQRKVMKKALSSLPGNSVSAKGGKKKKVEKKPPNKKTRGPLPAEPRAPPLPGNHPPSPGLPPGPPPPVPSGHSRPTFQRLGPPVPNTPRPIYEDDDQETYEDPGGYEPSAYEQSGYEPAGYDEEPDDVYDSVDPDEIAEISNSFPSSHSQNFVPQSPVAPPPPPPMAPPGAEGYDDDDQPIYDDGLDVDEEDDSFDQDSFDSSDPDEDYEEPYEENPPNPGLAPSENRSRLASDANIRSIMGKFYAHGVLKEEAGILATGASATHGGSVAAPPPPGPPPESLEEFIEEEDIYDTVPDEIKDMMLAEAAQEEGIFEDIYDLPPEQEALQAFSAPVIKPPITHSPKAPPPPPAAPPPEDEFEDDVYDIPSEVLEENHSQESVPDVQVYKPPAPPPPSNEPELPRRPPKPMGSPMGSPSLPRKQLFNKPPMRGPIEAKPLAHPPAEELPPSRPPKAEPAQIPPPPPLANEEPPKTNGVFNRPKLRSPIDRAQGPGGGAPPPRPPSNTKPPASPNSQRATGDSITERLARLTPQNSKVSPQQSPVPSPGLGRKSNTGSPDLPPTSLPPPPPGPPMKHNLKPVGNRNVTPPIVKKYGNSPKPGLKHSSSGEQSEETTQPTEPPRVVSPIQKVTNVTTKPPISTKAPKLSDRMKMFEDNKNKPPPPSGKPSLKPPPKPLANESPLSGRKMERNTNVNSLMNKFGGRSSPSNERSPSPDVKPFLPPKPGGTAVTDSSPKHPPWKKEFPSKETSAVTGSSPKHPPWKKKEFPPKEMPATPPLPSKPPVEPSSPTLSRPPTKQWPPPHQPEETKRTSSPLPKRNVESPSIAEELPPRRGSPSIRKKLEPPHQNGEPLHPRSNSPSVRRKLPSDSSDDQDKKPFTYPSYKPPVKASEDPPPTPSLPPRIPDPSPTLPRREPDPIPFLPPRNSPSLPHRNQELHTPRVPEPTPSLPPRLPESSPSLPPRLPESQPPRLPDTVPSLPSRVPEPTESFPKSRSGGHSPAPGPSLGGPPKLPSRLPPTGAPRLPDRNPPHRPPFSPPSEPEPRLPPRPAQQQFPPLPNRPPPKEPPQETIPNCPPRSVPHGSPAGKSWYHGNLDRKRAEAKLKRYAKDGTFIIRDSSKIQGEYSLSLWHSRGIRHLRIRLRDDKRFVLGEEKADELAFISVIELVDYHKSEPLHLKSGGDTVLRYECPH